MSNVQTHLDTIKDTGRRLHNQWQMASEHWSDGMEREFAQRHYMPLQQEHEQMATSASTLASVLQRAQRSVL